MLRVWSGLLTVAMLGAMATSAEAQVFGTPLNGKWLLNVPQEPFGPSVWTLLEESGVVTGTSKISDVPGVNIQGEMTGNKLFLVLYLLNSEFELDTGFDELPKVTGTNVAFVWVLQGKVQGFAVTTLQGVPIAAYSVNGRKI